MQIARLEGALDFKVQKEYCYGAPASAPGKSKLTLFLCVIEYNNLVFFSGIAKN